MVYRISALNALMRLENSTSHFTHWPIHSVSRSTASAKARSPRMNPECALRLELGREELIHRRLAQREPRRLLGPELDPAVVDRLELRVLARLFLVHRGRRLVAAFHDLVGELADRHARGLQPNQRQPVLGV